MLKRLGLFVLVSGGLLLQTTCGSVIPRRKVPPPTDTTIAVDLDAVKFFDLVDNTDISVADYMKREKKEFLLLMFGSVNCSTCNIKSLALTNNYLYSEPLFLDEKYQQFQLVGINTDSGNNKLRFTNIWEDPEQRHQSGYDFVRWQDPQGRTLKEYLLPVGASFGVPYTVMINRRGIAWYVLNSESLEIPELIARVKATIDGNSTPVPPTPKPPKPVPLPELATLAVEAPGRLRDVKITGCNGASSELGALYGDKQVRIVHVSGASCDATCAANITALKSVQDICSDGSSERSCAAVNLVGAASCTRSDVMLGGKEFFDVFSTFFNWKYRPYRNDGGAPIGLPPVKGPLTFAFADSGRLLFAREGAVTSKELKAIIDTPLTTAIPRPRGADFGNLHGDVLNPDQAPTTFSFATWRQRTRYSVVSTFDPECEGCYKEIQHWLTSGNVYDFCKADPEFCQIGLLETEGVYEGMTPTDFFYMKKTGMEAENSVGRAVPFFVDPEVLDGGLYRLYEGYFLALYPTWRGSRNGTAIYDQEGKVVYSFSFEETSAGDIVLETLKKLKN